MREEKICPVCKGTGLEIFNHISQLTGEYEKEQVRCGMCKGAGYILYYNHLERNGHHLYAKDSYDIDR